MTAERSSEVQYLRKKAKQFRDLAKTYKTEISAKLIEIACDLERRADEIDKGKEQPALARETRRLDGPTRSRRNHLR